MRAINIVLAHRDAASATGLVASLHREFRNTTLATTVGEIRTALLKFRAPFAVVDLELIGQSDLRRLCSDFPATAFVCIHRLADDQMWSDALAMGAMDCCLAGDLRGILLAANRYVALNRSQRPAAA